MLCVVCVCVCVWRVGVLEPMVVVMGKKDHTYGHLDRNAGYACPLQLGRPVASSFFVWHAARCFKHDRTVRNAEYASRSSLGSTF